MVTPRTRPVWPAYAIALLALFCALGGPAYAAGLVTGADIKDGTVTGADLKNESVKGADVRNGSLAAGDLSDAARADLAGQDGQDGEPGPSGTAGACGGGQELRWLVVQLAADGVHADDTMRIGRCVGTGPSAAGDGILQLPEQCDDGNIISGDGCSAEAQLEGQPSLIFFPDGNLTYVS